VRKRIYKERDDKLVSVKPILDRVSDWHEYPGFHENIEVQQRISENTRTGRPGGTGEF